MHDALTTYFAGEKSAGAVVAAIGLCMAAGAAIMWRAGGHKAFAWTLGVFALLELGIGIGLYLKTGPQVAGLTAQLGSDAARLVASETPRMVAVQRNFVILEIAWLVLIAAAAGVAVWKKGDARLSGIALGVLVNVSIILAFDVIAERRGARYLDALRAGPAAPPAAPR